jgi:hypothetical protein
MILSSWAAVSGRRTGNRVRLAMLAVRLFDTRKMIALRSNLYALPSKSVTTLARQRLD